jgi:hypothetical protein
MWSGGSGDGEENVDLAGVDVLLQGVVEVDGGLGRSRRRGAPGGPPVSTSGAPGGEELQAGRSVSTCCSKGWWRWALDGGDVGEMAAQGGVGGRRGAARIRGARHADRSDDLGIKKGFRRGRRLGQAPPDSIGGVQQPRTPQMHYYPRRTTHLYASDTDMWSRPLNGVRAPTCQHLWRTDNLYASAKSSLGA